MSRKHGWRGGGGGIRVSHLAFTSDVEFGLLFSWQGGGLQTWKPLTQSPEPQRYQAHGPLRHPDALRELLFARPSSASNHILFSLLFFLLFFESNRNFSSALKKPLQIKKKKTHQSLQIRVLLFLFLFPRKVVVLQKKSEEAFGFEIQVRSPQPAANTQTCASSP